MRNLVHPAVRRPCLRSREVLQKKLQHRRELKAQDEKDREDAKLEILELEQKLEAAEDAFEVSDTNHTHVYRYTKMLMVHSGIVFAPDELTEAKVDEGNGETDKGGNQEKRVGGEGGSNGTGEDLGEKEEEEI